MPPLLPLHVPRISKLLRGPRKGLIWAVISGLRNCDFLGVYFKSTVWNSDFAGTLHCSDEGRSDLETENSITFLYILNILTRILTYIQTKTMFYATQGTRSYFWRVFATQALEPQPISDQKSIFSTTYFRPDRLTSVLRSILRENHAHFLLIRQKRPGNHTLTVVYAWYLYGYFSVLLTPGRFYRPVTNLIHSHTVLMFTLSHRWLETKNMSTTAGVSDIEEFYAGKTVFITGGTGFLGKVLMEKLLRSCPRVERVYLLVRSKKNVAPKQRIDDLLDSKVSVRSDWKNLHLTGA